MKLAATLLFLPLAVATVLADSPPQPVPHEKAIFTGSAAVQALGYATYPFQVNIGTMTSAKIEGEVKASGGTGNDIVVFVVTDADMVNLKNGHTTQPLYNSGQVTVADIDASIPESGTYYLVFSNAFSGVTPKTVEGSVSLKWITLPPPQAVAQAEKKQSTALLARLLVLVVGGAVIGGGVVWLIVGRKKKSQPPG